MAILLALPTKERVEDVACPSFASMWISTLRFCGTHINAFNQLQVVSMLVVGSSKGCISILYAINPSKFKRSRLSTKEAWLHHVVKGGYRLRNKGDMKNLTMSHNGCRNVLGDGVVSLHSQKGKKGYVIRRVSFVKGRLPMTVKGCHLDSSPGEAAATFIQSIQQSFPQFSCELSSSRQATITKVVLTKPFSLETQSDSDATYKAPNILRRILSLFSNVRPGSDVSCFKLPPVLNMPKSELQCYAECVYSTALDMLSNLNNGKTALDRFICVVAWSISTVRPLCFGVAPYNPTLGETHHVSKGSLNVLLEQVSHHPPVSALHATNDKENIEIIWCHSTAPKFTGSSVEAQVHGKRKLKLHNHGETYEMNAPNLLIRIFPVPGTDWVGDVRIRCIETGLVAELSYISQSFFGFGTNRRLIKGKIFDSLSMKILYKIDGHWDSTVRVKNTENAEERVIYDAKQVISGLQAPIVKDQESVWATETSVVWSELSEAILKKEWEKAKEAKRSVEERQRELKRERESNGKIWIPKHFKVSYSKEEGWDCSPIQRSVPNAPIVAL
ncbi:hypothetical protein VNO78_22940 [Psophocarpus tetragonolobus]|uniref:Oxysterol-binding protein n=1 Tax=Psophocarpus tetragonolobus TaxID=3891 RepID=A0AAN9S5M9_PSOTE